MKPMPKMMSTIRSLHTGRPLSILKSIETLISMIPHFNSAIMTDVYDTIQSFIQSPARIVIRTVVSIIMLFIAYYYWRFFTLKDMYYEGQDFIFHFLYVLP
jgi:hypothetical protein